MFRMGYGSRSIASFMQLSFSSDFCGETKIENRSKGLHAKKIMLTYWLIIFDKIDVIQARVRRQGAHLSALEGIFNGQVRVELWNLL